MSSKKEENFHITLPKSLSSASTVSATVSSATTVSSCGANENGDGSAAMGDFRVTAAGALERARGYNWLIAATFVASEMIGAGIITLPTAINRTTLSAGLPLLIILAAMATKSAMLLGEAWVLMLELYPAYRTHCRKPYAEMGFRAIGPKMKTFVSVILNLTQFGASVCFLLLISRNVSNVLLSTVGSTVSYCWVILIVAAFIAPIFMCKSPDDFWQVVALGTVCTLVAVALIAWGVSADGACAAAATPPAPNFQNFLLALGTILFTVGGHAAFPTIVHDMRRPAHFKRSCALAFSTLVAVNVIVVLFAVRTYGDSLQSTVIESIQTPWIQYTVSLLIVGHCLFTLTLVVNPINQELEEYFQISHEFGVKRVAVRVGILLALVFVAESIPSFEKILNFIGGSLLTVTSLVFPPIFYVCLAAKKRARRVRRAAAAAVPRSKAWAAAAGAEYGGDDGPDYDYISVAEVIRHTNKFTLAICLLICATGIVLGSIATVTSARDIFKIKSAETVPCYLSHWLTFDDDDGGYGSANASEFAPKPIVTRCCGHAQTLSLRGRECAAPKFGTYTDPVF